MSSTVFTWLVPPLASLVAVMALTPFVIRLAHARGWVAHPTEDRWHTKPTALMGGIGIFVAASLGWMLIWPEGVLRWIWLGGGLIFLSGFVDDRWGVPPAGKLAVQVLAAGILIWGGLLVLPAWPIWFTLPLTLLWVVGITNAVNLLDNMDGLAAGISAIAGATLAALAWMNGQAELAVGALALAAAAAGFLVYNFNPARTFMGDCGSLFLGFSLAGMAAAAPSTGAGRGITGLLLVPAAVMAVPILDTTLVTVKRLLVGRSVAQGGRDHTSHRLVALGLSERAAVLTLYGVAAGFGALAVGIQWLEVGFALSLLIYAGVALAVLGAFLAATKVYDEETEERGRRRAGGRVDSDPSFLRALFRRRRELLGTSVDLALIVAAFVAAFYLRYDGVLPESAREALLSGLPVLVIAKLLTFHVFGLYRGLWWHAGTPEIIRTILGSVAGSALAVTLLALLFRLEGIPRSVLLIDGVLATMGLLSARFSFRGLRGLLKGSTSAAGARRVLVYGAGAEGALVARVLREAPDGGRILVGFLDDDPERSGRTLLGIPVLGPRGAVAQIAEEHRVEEVILTDEGEKGDAELSEALAATNLRVSKLSVVIEEVRTGGVAEEVTPESSGHVAP